MIIKTPAGEVLGIEIKSKPDSIEKDFQSGKEAFERNFPDSRFYVVSGNELPRKVAGTDIITVKMFLEMIEGI